MEKCLQKTQTESQIVQTLVKCSSSIWIYTFRLDWFVRILRKINAINFVKRTNYGVIFCQFCQPTGWVLSSQRLPPTYFVSVLTDIDGCRHYCACLSFHETVAMTTNKADEEDADDQEVVLPHHSQMFAPKSLVLITAHDFFETFRVG